MPLLLLRIHSRFSCLSSAEKMSTTTWSLQLLGFLVFVIYHIRSGYPLSTFVDFVALGMQSLVILVLASVFRRRTDALAALPVVGLVVALSVPARALASLQLTAAVVTTLALLPQIISNFKGRTRGGWSPISAACSTFGNAARVYTTVTLADANRLLLGQFIAGTLLNGRTNATCRSVTIPSPKSEAALLFRSGKQLNTESRSDFSVARRTTVHPSNRLGIVIW